ncbi:MAG: DEAD/DEAH box helicase [Anaerolineae bacterium]
MPLSEVLSELRAAYSAQVAAWRHFPERPARRAPMPAALHPALTEGLHRRGITALYTHQAQAVTAALRGENVCIVTPTASGKTLCYNLPVLQALLSDPAARALYLFPTKALAQDQVTELGRWQATLDAPVGAATYDGDTPTSARSRVRKSARVIVTNPDMLHTGILPHHTRWAELFEGLRVVVLDEMHTYRGVFGSHVANVLRRLRRIAAWHGASPHFILSSATIANPADLAERLVEAPVTLVDDDGAPRSERHFILINPPIVDARLGIRRSAAAEATSIARRCLAEDVQTAVFAGSRLTTEVILHSLQNGAGARVRGYRSGYLPQERRATEAGLRDGSVRGVVSTNALELGVDIGGLDAVIIAGYPGAIASTWQQAGRAGRRGSLAAAMLVARGLPLDQYLVAHPEYILGGEDGATPSPEHALVNPDNALILTDHIRCAAFELPFAADEAFGEPVPHPLLAVAPLNMPSAEAEPRDPSSIPPPPFLPPQVGEEGGAERGEAGVGGGEGQARVQLTQDILAFLADTGEVYRSGGRWHWLAEAYPAEAVGLRTAGADRVVILDETAAPRTIGEVDRASAPGMVHAGAIYLHDGAMYHVERLEWEAGRAFVRPVAVDYYTDGMGSVDVEIVSESERRGVPGGAIAHGEVEVTSKTTGYRQVRFTTGETLGWGEVDLPAQTMLTTAYWLQLDEATIDRFRTEGWWRFDPNDYGPTWAAQRDKARTRDGYRCRACGAPERPGRGHDVHHLQPFRSFGYARGHNRHDLVANRLENLVTLCPSCHRRAEERQVVRGVLSGLAHVLGNLAPLYLMCDPRDLGVLSEVKAVGTGLPTLTIYEQIPAGLGFAAALYERHAHLMADARDLIAACACPQGCPGCIGPTTDADPQAKAWALRLAATLMGEPS